MGGARGPTSALAAAQPKPKPKPKAKAKAVGQSGNAMRSKVRKNPGEETEINQLARDGEDESENKQKKKKQKTDPQVMARLQKLERNAVLTTDKWANKIKVMNKEVTESMAAAENYEQTKGFLNKQMGYRFLKYVES